MSKRTLQAVAIYIGAGWTGFGIVSWLVSRYGLNPSLEDAVLWAFLVLTPAVALIAEATSQTNGPGLKRWQKTAVSGNLLLALLAVVLILRPSQSAQMPTEATPPDESTAVAVPASARQTVVIFFPDTDGDAWGQRAFSHLLAIDLEQDPALTVGSAYAYAAMIENIGADPLQPIPLGLERRLAIEQNVNHFVDGSLSFGSGPAASTSVSANLTIHSTSADSSEQQVSCDGADLFALVDTCSAGLRIVLDTASHDVTDLPVAEISVLTEEALRQFTIGVDAFLARDFTTTIEALEQALEADPQSALVGYWLGLSLGAVDRDAEALEQLRLARKTDYRLTERSRFQLASTYFTQNGQPEEALAALENWTKLFPDSVEAQFKLGSMLETQFRSEDAANAYKEILRVKPKDLGAILRLVGIDQRAARFEEALARVTEAKGDNPQNPSLPLWECRLLRDLGRLDEALAVAQSALSLTNQPSTVLSTIASLQFRRGDVSEALESLDRAEQQAESEGVRASVLESRQALALRRGKLAEHLDILDSLRNVSGESPTTTLMFDLRRALSLADNDDPSVSPETAKSFEAVVAELSDLSALSVLPPLALLQATLGLADQATETIDRVKAIAEEYGAGVFKPFIPHWRGHLAEEAGDAERAAEFYAQAMALDPANTELTLELGRSSRKAGRLQDAKVALETTLVRYPAYPEANLEMALVLEQEGDSAAALEFAEVAQAAFAAADPDYKLAQRTRDLVQRLAPES